MKNFTRRGSWLDQASREVCVIYTAFLVFAFMGHLSFIAIAVYQIGLGYDDVVEHYLGGEDEEEVFFPKDFPELVEGTHFHAYIEGMVLLVLAHIFVAMPVSQGLKWGMIGLSFGSTFLDLLAPWFIRYLSPAAAYLQIFAWIGIVLSYFPLTLMPIYYIWRKK